jgi:hypothetical protein
MNRLVNVFLQRQYFVMVENGSKFYVKPPYEMEFTAESLLWIENEVNTLTDGKWKVKKHNIMSNCFVVYK